MFKGKSAEKLLEKYRHREISYDKFTTDLYETFYKPATRSMRRKYPWLSTDDSITAFTDAFMGLLKVITKMEFQPTTSIKALFYHIFRLRCIDMLNKERTKKGSKEKYKTELEAENKDKTAYEQEIAELMKSFDFHESIEAIFYSMSQNGNTISTIDHEHKEKLLNKVQNIIKGWNSTCQCVLKHQCKGFTMQEIAAKCKYKTRRVAISTAGRCRMELGKLLRKEGVTYDNIQMFPMELYSNLCKSFDA